MHDASLKKRSMHHSKEKTYASFTKKDLSFIKLKDIMMKQSLMKQ
jgi:hypothetical protein